MTAKPRPATINRSTKIAAGHYTGVFGSSSAYFDVSADGQTMTGFSTAPEQHFFCDGGKDYGTHQFTGSSQIQDGKFSFVVDTSNIWLGSNGKISVNGTFSSGTAGNLVISYDVNLNCGNYKKDTNVNFSLQTPAGKSCTVSLSKNSIGVGETVTVNATGTGGTVKSFISRTDAGSLSGLGNPIYTDTQGHKYYQLSSPTVSGLTEGSYKVFCDIEQEPNKCSSNPFCSSLSPVECAGWADCGASGRADLMVGGSTIVPLSCSVSGPTTATVGSPVSYSLTGTKRTELWYISTSAKDNQGSWAQTSGSISFPGAGNYYVVCNAYDDSAGTKCSGNPWLPLPAGWSSCTGSSKIEVAVAAVPPPPPPPTCTGAPCTGEGRERDWRGYWVPRDCTPFDNEADCKNVDRCNWNSACSNPGGGPTGGGSGSCPHPGDEKDCPVFTCPDGFQNTQTAVCGSNYKWDNCSNSFMSSWCKENGHGPKSSAPASAAPAAGTVYSGER